MTRLKLTASVAALTGAAVLVACAHEEAPRPGADVGLYFNRSGSTATLAYGRANSDNVGLVLQCEAGSRRVMVSDMARSASARTLLLTSGRARSDLAATVDNTTGQPTLWAQADITSPALQAFRRSGRIKVSSRGGGYGLTASREEQARVERFFRACERA